MEASPNSRGLSGLTGRHWLTKVTQYVVCTAPTSGAVQGFFLEDSARLTCVRVQQKGTARMNEAVTSCPTPRSWRQLEPARLR